MRFASAAAQAAGLAARALGWRPDEFWRATPAELALSLDAAPDLAPDAAAAPPSRAEFATMMERDADAR